MNLRLENTDLSGTEIFNNLQNNFEEIFYNFMLSSY